jgi:hypothetical protein
MGFVEILGESLHQEMLPLRTPDAIRAMSLYTMTVDASDVG